MKAGSDIISKIRGCLTQKLDLSDSEAVSKAVSKAVSNRKKFGNLSQNRKKFVNLSQNRPRRAKSSALVFFFLGLGRVMEIVDARAGKPCCDGSDAEIGGRHHPNSRRTRVRRFLALCTKGSGRLAESGCFPDLK